ncbi:MAG TPA: hypothetical protein VJH55_00355 [Candidatus Paceibacterota bacterium]
MRKFIVVMAILVILLGIFTPKIKQETKPQQPKHQQSRQSLITTREQRYTNTNVPVEKPEKKVIMVRVSPQFEK